MANLINQNWVFGTRAGLDFSTATPTPTSGFAINTGEGCASISDASGNLLIYTDGNRIWNSANTPVATGLLGNASSTQSAIIVPDPGSSQHYYVFTADGVTGGNNHVNGVRIDVSIWTTQTLASLMTMPPTANRSATEKVTAIQHANCVDYWVVTIIQNTTASGANDGPGIFRVFLVNAAGVQFISDTPMGLNVADVGYLKASPNGARLAIANYQHRNVLIYDFDNALGVINLSSLVTVAPPVVPVVPNHPTAAYGVEFSPNNNVLYYSLLGVGTGSTAAINNGYIFQVDLTVSAPTSTQIAMYANPAGSIGYALGALQLGMDGRIYVAKQDEGTVGAILSPNVLGAGVSGCNPNMSFITLLTNTRCNLGLPNLLSNPCDCPCDGGNPCDEDIKQANVVLNGRADLKQFTIFANGGPTSLPSCQLAFTNTSFAPIFTLEWGDGLADQFESEDFEVIYIRVHNPFLNLMFRNLTIFNIKITPNQTLPDGDDAVRIVPAVIDCFDEIGPCSHVSRDFALVIDHALVGTYQISFDYCIEEIAIVSGTKGSAVFDIKVVAS